MLSNRCGRNILLLPLICWQPAFVGFVESLLRKIFVLRTSLSVLLNAVKSGFFAKT